MKTYTINLCIERDEEELELEITGTVSSYVRAVVHLAPERCSPAEGGEVEITKITLDNESWEGELTDSEHERAEDKLFEAAQSDDDEPDPMSDDEWDRFDYPDSFERDEF